MSPEERELLNKSVSLAEENNAILRSMRRSQRISHFMSYIYWLFIIVSVVGGYYFAQPYIDQGLKIFNSAKSNLDSLGSLMNSAKK